MDKQQQQEQPIEPDLEIQDLGHFEHLPQEPTEEEEEETEPDLELLQDERFLNELFFLKWTFIGLLLASEFGALKMLEAVTSQTMGHPRGPSHRAPHHLGGQACDGRHCVPLNGKP